MSTSISVIVPAFNSEDTLAEQLSALSKQQDYYQEWEIIVVDNQSTDATAQVAKMWQRSMANLRVVSAAEKRGPAHARNVGAQHANGQWFLFCDSDDVVATDWVSCMAEVMQDHDFVVGVVEVKTLNTQTLDGGTGHVYGKNGMSDPYLNFMPYAMTCNCGVSRAAFERAGGFSEAFMKCQDVDLSWRLQLLGYELHEAQQAVVHYRYRNSAQQLLRVGFQFSRAHVQLYKHYEKHGMQRPSRRDTGRRYRQLLRAIKRWGQLSQTQKGNFALNAGICLGRIRGSLQFRTLYL